MSSNVTRHTLPGHVSRCVCLSCLASCLLWLGRAAATSDSCVLGLITPEESCKSASWRSCTTHRLLNMTTSPNLYIHWQSLHSAQDLCSVLCSPLVPRSSYFFPFSLSENIIIGKYLRKMILWHLQSGHFWSLLTIWRLSHLIIWHQADTKDKFSVQDISFCKIIFSKNSLVRFLLQCFDIEDSL